MDQIRIYSTLDSTNKEAQRLLAAGALPNGTALLARTQTEGKGQYGRSWYGEPDQHLALSLILVPHHLEVKELPLVSMKTCLGIIRALHQIDPALPLQIKWPNDIYADGKKLCGILIENAIAGTSVQHIILGIGLNVNEQSFPAELPNAISLYHLTGQDHDLYQVAQLVRHHVLENVDTPELYWKQEYDTLLYGLNQENEFDHQGKKIIATVEGVDEQGRIILSLGDDHPLAFYSHEVKWIIQ